MSQMFEFTSFSLLFPFLLFLFLILRTLMGSKSQFSKPRLPPGPRKLPIIGNIHQMIGGLPHMVMRDLALKYGPIMHLKLGEIDAVIISSPIVAEEMLKTNETAFLQRPQFLALEIMSYDFSSMAFAPYDNYWKQMRKLSNTELLSAKSVQSFKSTREYEVQEFIEYIKSTDGAPFNFSKKNFSFFNNIIFKVMSGRNCKDQEEFIFMIDELIVLSSGFSLHDLFPSIKILPILNGARSSLMKMHKQMDRILNSIINDHKEQMRAKDYMEEDLLHVLLKNQGSTGSDFTLTTENIKAYFLDIFAAGSETQGTTIDWIMVELMRNPNVLEKAQAEVRQSLNGKSIIREEDIQGLPYLQAIIKEILRLHPATPFVPRASKGKCQINGYDIPENSKVLINLWAMFRDSTQWPNPESFQPERFLGSSLGFMGTNTKYIPFGYGRRICPGVTFAITTMEVLLAQLLYHFDWKLPDGVKAEEFDMSESFGASTKRKDSLYLIATPFDPQNT